MIADVWILLTVNSITTIIMLQDMYCKCYPFPRALIIQIYENKLKIASIEWGIDVERL